MGPIQQEPTSGQLIGQPEPQPQGVELDEVREIFRMYARALTGVNVQVMTSDELYNRGLGWVSLEAQDLGGGAVLLPEVIESWPSTEENFHAYKVLATHQAAHLEAGTLGFALERPSTLFSDLRPRLRELSPPETEEAPDFYRFFGLFTHRKLATDIFNIYEDFRVDNHLRREYLGIRSTYQKVHGGTVGMRPHVEILPLREAVAEMLFRYGLGVVTQVSVPEAYRSYVYRAAGLTNLLHAPAATVEDAAEATLRAYCLLRRVPNLPASQYRRQGLVTVDLADARYDTAADDPDAWLSEFQALNTGGRRLRRGDPLGEPGEVVYKGIPPSELLRHLSFDLEEAAAQRDLNLDDLDQPLPEEIEQGIWETLEEERRGLELQSEAEPEELAARVQVNGHRPHEENAGAVRGVAQADERVPGSAMDRDLCEGEPEPYVYPEWDHQEESYRPDWCTIWQRRLKEGTTDFFNDTLQRHHVLVSQVEKRFEMLRPELFRLRRGLVDGDDLDLDRLIEAHVEMKAAGHLNDKIYQRRDKQERSVSILFLLDMSISTSEALDLSRHRPPHAGWSSYEHAEVKRIIDVEKESLVVLTRALERVGDRYGIYGFSGRGRHGSRFYVVKDLSEPLDNRAMARMETIAPVQATRMGPAIRHAASILSREPTKIRILVLISDGQPQDLDYGSEAEGGRAADSKQSLAEQRKQEKEYAVNDTHKALAEARSKGIVPYLLSIDRHGYDYLRMMCGDFGYEVVHDIRVLPRRLVSLYSLLAN